MPKAAKKSITQKLSVNGKGRRTADADFFAKIARRAAEWRKDLAKKTASDTVSGACQIEFEVAASKVLTKSGFHAKCRAVAQDGWDADDMVVIAFLLGRDAERL